MRLLRTGSVVLALVVGAGVGAVLALSRGPAGATLEFSSTPLPTIEPLPANTEPANFKVLLEEDARLVLDHPVVLAWQPGGLDHGFVRRVRSNAAEAVVVASGNAWMTDAWDHAGAKVDHAPSGYAYPLETASIDPAAYRHFVLPSDRWMLQELAARDRDQVPGAILGETSARIRGLEAGATLALDGARVRVVGVLPDEFVGAHEVVVGPTTGRRLGITLLRYVLIDPDGVSRGSIDRRLQAASAGRPVVVRWPGETPFLRHGDAVQPQVILKERFGEFAARPADDGTLEVGPGWQGHLDTRTVLLLGDTRCAEELFPQLEGAMRQIRREGLAHLIHENNGCHSARFLNYNSKAGISHHAWGVALDINASENPFGETPVMDPRIVKIMEQWGFTWGGDWKVPDGMHFEWIGQPREDRRA